MSRNHPKRDCHFFNIKKKRCRYKEDSLAQTGDHPLSQSCCKGKMRVSAVNGDRKTCAKMANLGVLPGSELEILCKGGGRQCMVKINGGTLSLDALTAENILVTPV